jgi:23S rRNA (cytosine1962-C5)-methyltransferase
VRQHHPWVFSGAIAALPNAEDGSIVEVVSSSGDWLARGYLNRKSQIQVRLLTWEQDQAVDDIFWAGRIEQAVAARTDLTPDTNALRLVHGENDFLPGLVVDRFGDYLVLQAGTLAIDQRKRMLAECLLDITGARGVVERSELALRRQEGLGESSGLICGAAPIGPFEVHEGNLRFLVDLIHGQKTGFYTDQRDNRRRTATICAGKRVLNGFSYTGAFAVHALAGGATHVTNIDSSLDALELAEENLRLNGYDPEICTENIAGDLFEILRDWRSDPSGPRFDVIILDPPKFANNQAQMERALRGYKEINLQALQLLESEGHLVTFSCSGLVSLDLFQKVVFGAAIDARRDVQVQEWLHPGPDHPVAITFPEGEYLKGLLCRVI